MKRLATIFVTIETICIIILLTLLIIPKETIENFANVEIKIERR